MPAFYAHYRFGKQVVEEMKRRAKEERTASAIDAESVQESMGETDWKGLVRTIERHRTQFDIGLQGPDIFFFYRPYAPSAVARYGHHLHKVSALPFFENGLSVVERHGRDSGQYAYLLGFICHFALDSQCHPRIAEMIEETGVQHLELEEELEKYLLRRDGEEPLRFPLTDLVPSDLATCRSIAPFYEDITPKIVKQSLGDLRRVKKLLTAPGKGKQGVINTAMRMTGRFSQLKGLMHQRRDNPACADTNIALFSLMEKAACQGLYLIECFDHSLVRGETLCEDFDRNFE